MAEVNGVRTAGGELRQIKDVGEYDIWSSAICAKDQSSELYVFSYALGGPVTGASSVTATKAETNLYAPNTFINEAMTVYSIAIQICRQTPKAFNSGNIYNTIGDDLLSLESSTHFGFYVGGDKPFTEGKLTWFAEAGGFYSASTAAYANNVPTPASARVWAYRLPISQIEKFWGRLEFPRGPLALGGPVQVLCRLLGVRSREVR